MARVRPWHTRVERTLQGGEVWARKTGEGPTRGAEGDPQFCRGEGRRGDGADASETPTGERCSRVGEPPLATRRTIHRPVERETRGLSSFPGVARLRKALPSTGRHEKIRGSDITVCHANDKRKPSRTLPTERQVYLSLSSSQLSHWERFAAFDFLLLLRSSMWLAGQLPVISLDFPHPGWHHRGNSGKWPLSKTGGARPAGKRPAAECEDAHRSSRYCATSSFSSSCSRSFMEASFCSRLYLRRPDASASATGPGEAESRGRGTQ